MPAETHVEGGDMSRDEVLTLIRDRLADILEIEPDTIKEGDSFVDDLDADSLALIELVESLEEELSDRTVGFRIEDEDLEDLKTVPREHKLVLEAATVASLRDGVEEGFCQAFLPVSMAGRLVRSKEVRPSHSLMLNFVLIAGVGADDSKTQSVATKFRRALLG